MFNFLIFSKEQWIKIGKGALIAFLAAGVTAAAQFLLQIDFGQWNPVVQAVLGIVINAAKVSAKL